MRTRNFLLTGLLAMLAAAYPAQAQTKPVVPPPPPDAVPVASPPSADVSVKDSTGVTVAPATKRKDTSGSSTLTVDFPDEEIRNILRAVAELFDLNIVIPDTLQGKTSIKLHDVSWRQIFQVVLTPVGYTFVEDGNIIKIVSNESLTQEPVSTEIFMINYAKASEIQPTLASLVDATAGGKIVVDPRTNSLVITERPSRMKRIKPVIEMLDRPTAQVMIESKFVEISNNDVKNIGVNWSSLSGETLTLTPGSQGFFNYTHTYGSSAQNGLNGNNTTTGNTSNSSATGSTNGSSNNTSVSSNNGLITNTSSTSTNSGPTASSNASSGNGTTSSLNATNTVSGGGQATNILSAVFSADQFKVVLSALQQFNDSKIVSNPTIVTLNNTEATINVGQQFPIPSYTFNQQTGTFEVSGFLYKDIGIILKVTPQVNSQGFIKLNLAPEVSQNQGTTSFGGASGASIPIIGSRKATTQVSLKDGYTMGIGGLISTNFNKVTNSVPFLGSIPIIGYLFKQKNTDDVVDNLVIFITAKTISAEGAPAEQIFNSKELRQFELKRSDLPGYRDGSDPFMNEAPRGSASGSH